MKRSDDFLSKLQIVKSYTKDVPYRFVKDGKDYTPKPLTHPKFNEIKGKFDLSDFLSLFVCENFIPPHFPILFNEDRSALITGLLTGSRYGPSTFPLKTILRPEPKIGSDKKKKVDTQEEDEREFISPFVEETFQISLVETTTVSLYSRETSVNVFEIERKPMQTEKLLVDEEEVEHEFMEEEGEEEEDEVIGSEEIGEEEESDPYILKRTVRLTKIPSLRKPSKESSDLEEKFAIFIKCLNFDEPFKEIGMNAEEPYYLEVAINTDNPIRKSRLIEVSPYTMHYDLLRPQIEKIVTKKPHQFEDPRLIQPDYEDISTCVLDSPEFYLVFHSIEKLLEANYYRNYHRIYNNPSYLHDLPKDQKLALIFTFKQPKKLKPKQDCEVTSIAWHPLYKYLIGVGYGKMHLEKNARGMFCIWNIKNPSYPERMYNFKHPVTSFSFCKVYPYAVALTFYNGQMMIINILARKLINMCDNTNFMKDYMQITHITWFKGEEGDYYPVTSSKSGDMYKFKVDNFLYPDLLLDLPRKYGETKGIEQCMRIFSGDENAKPLKIGISTFTQHPKNYLLYLVGTDDGYVHICSKWFSMKDTDVFAAHEGPITSIEFHHETDKLFLTSGNDYYVRVWAYLIYTPLMCFTTKKEIVRYAKWASFNIMQIVAMGEIYLDIWDIRRINNSVPITTYENTERSNNLIFNVSPFGPHVLLGDEKGDVHLLIYNYTKYEPPFKMQILARALRNHVKCRDPDLWRQVEQLIPEFKVKNVKDDPIDILEESDE